MLFLFVPEMLPEPGNFLVAEWFCPGKAAETGMFPLCGGGDHSLESVSQCLEEELPAELVGNMVGLNAGGDTF